MVGFRRMMAFSIVKNLVVGFGGARIIGEKMSVSKSSSVSASDSRMVERYIGLQSWVVLGRLFACEVFLATWTVDV